MMRLHGTIGLALVGLVLSPRAFALCAEQGKRLGVSGIGRVDVRPDVMEVSATVTGSAELAADALRKFRDNRRHGIEAVKRLKISGLEVKGTGASVLSSAAMQQLQARFGRDQPATPGHTTFSETLTFRVPGIDHLSDDQVQDLASKILDAARDAGLTLGQPAELNQPYYSYSAYRPQIVYFRIGDPDEAQMKALDEAAKDARRQAEEMAKRLKLSIGNVVSAREATTRRANMLPAYSNVSPSRAPAVESSTSLQKITVEAELFVEYEILN